VTYWTMLAATLAIAGAPGFSGFFSKDEILFQALAGPYRSPTLWVIGLLGALLTSFYMFRLFFLTFHGSPRYDEHKTHVHEAPKNMLAPLVILAVLATAGGWWAAPKFWGGANYFSDYLAPVFASSTALATAGGSEAAGVENHTFELEMTGVAVFVALIGFLIAWWFYIREPEAPSRLAKKLAKPYQILLNKYYVDEVYGLLFVRLLLWVSTKILWHAVDEGAIDAAVNGVATVTRRIGQDARRIQSGNERSYASWVVIGAVGVTALLLGIWGMAR
jgi:NADH-quinone oxidoreductase subunit L